MKLATLKDSTRDGKLVVVSKDLTRCSEVGHIARTLQAALDDWAHVAPRLRRVAQGLETGSQPTMRFHEHDAASPLPRAYLWAGGSGGFVGPRDAAIVSDSVSDIASRVQAAVITDDVQAGTKAGDAVSRILLVFLAHTVSQGNLDIVSTFSPVAVTPEELEDGWVSGTATLSLLVSRNGKAAIPTRESADFSGVVSRTAAFRPLGVGSILAAAQSGLPAPVAIGDLVRVEVNDRKGHSIFGAIEQTVQAAADQ